VSGTANEITVTNPTTTPQIFLANPGITPGDWTVGGNGFFNNNATVTGLLTANGGFLANTATVSSLVSGQCVQASTAGLLTTTGSPCGNSGGGITGSGNSGNLAEFTGSASIGNAPIVDGGSTGLVVTNPTAGNFNVNTGGLTGGQLIVAGPTASPQSSYIGQLPLSQVGTSATNYSYCRFNTGTLACAALGGATGNSAFLNLSDTTIANPSWQLKDSLLDEIYGLGTGGIVVNVPSGGFATLFDVNLTQVAAIGSIGGNTGIQINSGSVLNLPMTGTQCLEEVSGIVTATGSACGSGGGSSALSAITAATTTNTIANGNNGGQVWNWAQTSASQTAFTFGETTAATGSGDQELLVKTLAGSTSAPLTVISSLTGSQNLPTVQITPTWNTTGVVDAALFINVTNAASGTGSTLIDAQVGAVSQWKADKTGQTTQNGPVNVLSDGVHAGSVQLLGNTTVPSLTANTFSIIGPNSVSFTAWAIQMSTNSPSVPSLLKMGTSSGGISQGSPITIQGTDTSILSSGTISGTSILLCTDGNGGATTSSCPTSSLPSGTQGNDLINTSSGTGTTYSARPNVIHTASYPAATFDVILAACSASPTPCYVIGDPSGTPIQVGNTPAVIGSFTQQVIFENQGVALECVGTVGANCIAISQWGSMSCRAIGIGTPASGCMVYTSSSANITSMVTNATQDGTQSAFTLRGFNFVPNATATIVNAAIWIVAVEGKGVIEDSSVLGIAGTNSSCNGNPAHTFCDLSLEDGLTTGSNNQLVFKNNAFYGNGKAGNVSINIVSSPSSGNGTGSVLTFIGTNVGDGLGGSGCISGAGCMINIDGSTGLQGSCTITCHYVSTITFDGLYLESTSGGLGTTGNFIEVRNCRSCQFYNVLFNGGPTLTTGLSISNSGSTITGLVRISGRLLGAHATNIINNSITGYTSGNTGPDFDYMFPGMQSLGTYIDGVETVTGLATFSGAGAASTPGLAVTGAPYHGGTATTNFPQLYINDGTGPTTFSTSGTEFGINTPSGFTGNFLDFHVNGAASIDTINYLGTLTISGATAGFLSLGQGSTNSTGTTNVTYQAPTSVTSYLVTVPGTAGQGTITGTLSGTTITQGFSGDSGHSAVVTTGSGTSIGSTQLCSTTICPAGTYRVNVYIDITTACGTTGTYVVNLIYTDDQGSKTVPVNINGSGSVPATGVLTTTSTANYGENAQIIRSTGAASINYSTTAAACGTAGPMVGKLYLSVEPLM
jgi:hypothetical protein